MAKERQAAREAARKAAEKNGKKLPATADPVLWQKRRSA